jgi:hypothetical protein
VEPEGGIPYDSLSESVTKALKIKKKIFLKSTLKEDRQKLLNINLTTCLVPGSVIKLTIYDPNCGVNPRV